MELWTNLSSFNGEEMVRKSLNGFLRLSLDGFATFPFFGRSHNVSLAKFVGNFWKPKSILVASLHSPKDFHPLCLYHGVTQRTRWYSGIRGMLKKYKFLPKRAKCGLFHGSMLTLAAWSCMSFHSIFFLSQLYSSSRNYISIYIPKFRECMCRMCLLMRSR